MKQVSHLGSSEVFSISVKQNINYVTIANVAEKNHIREQKRALETSAAKRERDFYLSKVEQSRALSSIEERINKVSIHCFT